MAKYKDRKETPKERNDRRKRTNINHQKKVQDYCSDHGIRFRVTNRGHHWRTNKRGKTVEWWPSSAKVVVNKNWQKGIHCHDYNQFIRLLKVNYANI